MVLLAVFAAAFGLYAWTAAPAVGWLDSAEFVAASAGLGVPHPPGHPIPTLLGKLVMLLPFGDAPFRGNLASALAGALAAAALYAAAVKAARAAAPALEERVIQIASAASALTFAACGAAWEQSVRAEVYAVEAALVLLALAFVLDWLRSSDARALYAAALALGLALANHHFVTLTFFLPVAAAALVRRPRLATALRTAAFGLLGLVAFAYLPIRAAHHPEVDWGDPESLSRFFWVISAKAFQKAVGQPPVLSEELATTSRAFVLQLLPAVPFVIAGAFALARRRAPLVALALLGAAALGVGARAVLGFDLDNPDAFGYLLPALGAAFTLAAAGLAALVARVPRGRVALAALVLVALPAAQLVRYTGQSSLRRGYAADGYGRAVLEGLPPRTLLVTSYYETAFGVWALQGVEGDRPDVVLIDRNLLTHPGADLVARARHPELAPLIDAPLRGGRPTPVAELARLARGRPVAFELAPNLDAADPALRHLAPDGPIAWFSADEVPADARAAAESADARHLEALSRRLRSPSPADRHGAARVLAFNASLDAWFYCAVGRAQAARAALARAREIVQNPDDETLAEIERDCVR